MAVSFIITYSCATLQLTEKMSFVIFWGRPHHGQISLKEVAKQDIVSEICYPNNYSRRAIAKTSPIGTVGERWNLAAITNGCKGVPWLSPLCPCCMCIVSRLCLSDYGWSWSDSLAGTSSKKMHLIMMMNLLENTRHWNITCLRFQVKKLASHVGQGDCPWRERWL
jgi:hypothetical protein